MSKDVYRVIQEVVTGYSDADKRRQALRAMAEVLSSYADVRTRAQVARMSVATIGSSARLARGLNLPSVTATNFTLFIALALPGWDVQSRKQFGLVGDSPNEGIFLRQTGVAGQVQFIMQFGSKVRFAQTFSPAGLTGIHILTVRRDLANNLITVKFDRNQILSGEDQADLNQLMLKHLGMVLPDGAAQNHQTAEVILYGNAVNNVALQQIENYLYCKWVSPGPSEDNNFCIPF